MRRAALRLHAAVVVATLAFAAPSIAFADPSAADKETARSLVEQGDKLTASGDAAGALKMYKGAHTIMGVPSTGLRLGRAQVNAGQLVEARDTFLSVARFPQTAGEPAAFTDARTRAQAEAESLQSRIPSIEIVPSGLAANVTPTVKIDDQTVPSAAGLLPQKVNPGAHTIVVSAPGYSDAKAQVTVKEAETQRVPVTLVQDASSPPVAVTAPPIEADGSRSSGGSTKRIAGFVVGGAGIVGIGIGAVFGLQAFSKKSDRDGHCTSDGSVCDATGIALDSDGRSAATSSTISFAAGLVAIGVGTYLIVTSKSPSSSSASASAFAPTRVSLAPLVGAGTGGLEMRGAF